MLVIDVPCYLGSG